MNSALNAPKGQLYGNVERHPLPLNKLNAKLPQCSARSQNKKDRNACLLKCICHHAYSGGANAGYLPAHQKNEDVFNFT